MIEIERKYLVKSQAFREQAVTREHIVQGFLNTDPDRTVRVRITENSAFLTVKGRSDESGLSRFEWEHQITPEEGKELLALCETPLLEKYRYAVPSGRHIFEVDEFLGANRGLLLAEVELENVNDIILKPDWLGKEVTGRKKYYNSRLIKKPYSLWKK